MATKEAEAKTATATPGTEATETAEPKATTMAEDIRTAAERALARLDTYDPKTISMEDAASLYVDLLIVSKMLDVASSIVKRRAKGKAIDDKLTASLERLGLTHVVNFRAAILDIFGDD